MCNWNCKCVQKRVYGPTIRGEPACDTTHTHITLTLWQGRTRLSLPPPPSRHAFGVASIQHLHVLETSVCPHQTRCRLSPPPACFHELPTEETFARTSGAHRTIRAHVRGFGLTPLTAGRYASAARLPSRLPNAPSRSHSHTLVCTTGAFNRAFPFDSRMRPHATCAASPSRG